MEKRLSCAQAELRYMKHYDYVVINDEVETAAKKMEAILLAETCRRWRNKDILSACGCNTVLEEKEN